MSITGKYSYRIRRYMNRIATDIEPTKILSDSEYPKALCNKNIVVLTDHLNVENRSFFLASYEKAENGFNVTVYSGPDKGKVFNLTQYTSAGRIVFNQYHGESLFGKEMDRCGMQGLPGEIKDDSMINLDEMLQIVDNLNKTTQTEQNSPEAEM